VKIKNWEKFQHYKDRSPHWIKLYKSILDDVEWHNLSGDDAKALIMLWLIAAEAQGQLPHLKQLAFRLRMKEVDAGKLLTRLTPWLVQDASNVLADCYQDASNPLAECYQPASLDKRREEKIREEARSAPRSTSSMEKPDDVPEGVWADFLAIRKARKAPVTPRVLEGIRTEAAKVNWTIEAALKECVLRGWQSFKADWVNKTAVATSNGRTFVKEVQHMPNMPLGTIACNCQGCIQFRARKTAAT